MLVLLDCGQPPLKRHDPPNRFPARGMRPPRRASGIRSPAKQASLPEASRLPQMRRSPSTPSLGTPVRTSARYPSFPGQNRPYHSTRAPHPKRSGSEAPCARTCPPPFFVLPCVRPLGIVTSVFRYKKFCSIIWNFVGGGCHALIDFAAHRDRTAFSAPGYPPHSGRRALRYSPFRP